MADSQVTTVSNLSSILKSLTQKLCSFGECDHNGRECANCGRRACPAHGERCPDYKGFYCEDCSPNHGALCESAQSDESDPVNDYRRDAVRSLGGAL